MRLLRLAELGGAQRHGLPVIGAQEECVQARRGDGQGVDPCGVQPADDGVEVLGVDGEPAVDVAVEPLGDVVRDARGVGEARGCVDGDRVDVGAGVPSQFSEGSGRHGPAPADDAHPVGEGLDLAEDVAGQQNRAALLAPLADDLLEGLFHERIQPGGGLVEDEQVGVGGEGGDQGDLLPVALGVVADPLGRVEVEPSMRAARRASSSPPWVAPRTSRHWPPVSPGQSATSPAT